MFLWYWKFSILCFAALMIVFLTTGSIDSMAEMNQIFAFGGVTLIVWMMEAVVNVVNHLRKES